MSKIKLFFQILRNMGWRYVSFRAAFELKRKTGLLKQKFPIAPTYKKFISLDTWKKLPAHYFFKDKEHIQVSKRPNASLKAAYQDFLKGRLPYFNATTYDIGRDYDWITNPSNGYQYDINKHWLDIPDLSEEAGDIKYVWEKSRFSYIYTIIRYDYHFQEDCAELVFDEIEDWINKNPINQGPNWRCSQEISLRTMNWLFALHYYKQSPLLDEVRFQKIMHCIYWQLKHVRANINFSRIAVRNNHAVTEVLMLYLGGLLLPFFPEAIEWKHKGKQWFEEEIAYQVYEDGTFLQYSHNYHRVLIQLMTQAFYLAALNGDHFKKRTYDRAYASLNYLYQCINLSDGHLPNYGANDGALFFKLTDSPYRDYRPQLNDLACFFGESPLFTNEESQEGMAWYTSNLKIEQKLNYTPVKRLNLNSFDDGGYYLMRDDSSFTFIKCGSYKDRPSHADNLHIDIWYEGENIIRDAGTYRYNAAQELVRYFNGTSAHNTVTLNNEDQMEKGPRFIWLNWSQAILANLSESIEKISFRGKIHAFHHLGKNIYHTRIVEKDKNYTTWEITDAIEHSTNLPMQQIWNISDDFESMFSISAIDENNEKLESIRTTGYYSGLYGHKEETTVLVFASAGKKIATKIQRR